MKRSSAMGLAPVPVAVVIFLLLLFATGTRVFAAGDPASVTIAGSLQSELGAPGDWDPAWAGSHLTYDAADDVWQAAWSLPAGDYEYKAALNDSWDVNYGAGGVQDGANIALSLAADTAVKFYYDHKSHWITDNHNSAIAVAAGSFQSELGAPGDWDPTNLRSWLEDLDGDGTYTFVTTALPAGDYETKVALYESWDVNYGAGGVQNGPNIPFTVPVDHAQVTFSYVSATHMLSVEVVYASLTLSKAATPTFYRFAGQVIQYTYTVENTGTAIVTGPFSIDDDLVGTFQCGTATSLAPGARIVCTAAYTVDPGDLGLSNDSEVTNQATASGWFGAQSVISNTVTATVRQVSPAGITSTSATSLQFIAGTAPDLTSLSYSANPGSGKVKSVTPGSFAFFSGLVAPQTAFVMQVKQSNILGWKPLGPAQTILYDGSGAQSTARAVVTVQGGDVRVQISGASVGAVYYLRVKYEAATLAGQRVAAPLPTNTYSLVTWVNGIEAPATRDGISIVPK